jgi:hypothetical protein
MRHALSSDTILQASPLCVARPQKEQYLFYHYRTDELHLVSPEGYYLYQLCDGLRSVQEVEDLFAAESTSDAAGAASPVRSFFEELVARGILEVADD